MAGTSSISGLISGLDTKTIIESLMAIEKNSQTLLKTKQSTEQSIVSALQSINSSFSSLSTAAESLAKASTWQTVTGTSSNSNVTVSTDTGATTASFKLTVDSLATSSQAVFSTASALSDTVTSQSLTLTTGDGTLYTIDTGDGSLQDVISGINEQSSETGISATAVKVADGSYKLLVQSTATGADTAFTLTNDDGSDLLGGATVTAGTDAQITLSNGITATSSSNTFEELMTGVSLTLADSMSTGDTATITLSQDSSTVAATVSAFVDQVNSLLSTIDSATKYATAGDSSSTSGVLAGNSTVIGLRNSLLSSVFGGTGSMSSVGIQTDRYGNLVFDEETFKTAYAADPAGVAAMFTANDSGEDGWAARVQAVADEASDSYTGSITRAITSHQSISDNLQERIDDWDLRLELRQSTLEAKFNNMETILSTLNSQSEWLSSQIDSLTSSSSD